MSARPPRRSRAIRRRCARSCRSGSAQLQALESSVEVYREETPAVASPNMTRRCFFLSAIDLFARGLAFLGTGSNASTLSVYSTTGGLRRQAQAVALEPFVRQCAIRGCTAA